MPGIRVAHVFCADDKRPGLTVKQVFNGENGENIRTTHEFLLRLIAKGVGGRGKNSNEFTGGR
jgi:hypothetical protein